MSEKQKSAYWCRSISGKSTFLKDAIESVQNQTLKPSELVLVEDGPLTPELYQVLDQMEAESDIPVKRYPLEQNQGLGLALRQGCLQCQYDISPYGYGWYSCSRPFWETGSINGEGQARPIRWTYCRVYWQSWWDCFLPSFPTSTCNIVAIKRMRSAFNHMTVMFKGIWFSRQATMRMAFIWRMTSSGSIWLLQAKTGNLDQILCKVRVRSRDVWASWRTALSQTLSSSSSTNAEERANFLHGVCQECCHSDGCCSLSRICPEVYFYETVTKKGKRL